MPRIALTGAAGHVAALIRPYLAERYTVHLTDIKSVRPSHSGESFFRADLRSERQLRRALKGCDAVIHLGGIPREDRFDRLLNVNVHATQKLLDAARSQGIRRIILASTGHVTGFYSRREAVDESSPVRPDSLYAVSKAASEALARYYADKYAMEICCVRIGRVSETPELAIDRNIWCSARDLASLFGTVLETPALHFEVVYGVSDNAHRWWCTERLRSLGFVPRDSADRHILRASNLPQIGELVQGGDYAARDFSGDIRRFA